MITMFSGNPRAGKTASMVDLLIDLAKDRPLYVHAPSVRRKGVDPFHEHLKIPHVAVDADKWPELVPDGAILVIDEVQDLWRPRGPGVKPHAAITELETHGHRGIDIFVTTQKPRLVDQAVRDLVGRHVHIRDTGWLGRHSYEWPECSETLAWKTCVLKKRFKVPKRVFDIYKSANLHTQAPRGRSFMPMVAGFLAVATVFLVYRVYRSIAEKTAAKPSSATAAVLDRADGGVSPSSASKVPAVQQGPRWPVYEAEPAKANREPYSGRGLQLEGTYTVGGQQRALFGVVVDGVRVGSASLRQVAAMGYAFVELGPCAGVLKFGALERLVTCQAAHVPVQDRPAFRDQPESAHVTRGEAPPG